MKFSNRFDNQTRLQSGSNMKKTHRLVLSNLSRCLHTPRGVFPAARVDKIRLNLCCENSSEMIIQGNMLI